METFVAVLHISVALILIALVLVQDSKSGSVGGAFGGGGSNSVLGATGATTIAQKMTRWMAVIFACTSIGLTAFSAKQHRSIIDSMPAAPPVENPATTPIDAAAAPVAVPVNAVPASPATTETK